MLVRRKFVFVAIYALLCEAKINPKILSAERMRNVCLPPDNLTTSETEHGFRGTGRECDFRPIVNSHVTSSPPLSLCTKPVSSHNENHPCSTVISQAEKYLNLESGIWILPLLVLGWGASRGNIYSCHDPCLFLLCVHK